jgi:hypothetical protein
MMAKRILNRIHSGQIPLNSEEVNNTFNIESWNKGFMIEYKIINYFIYVYLL